MPKMQSTTDIADNAGAKMTKQRQTHLRMTSENDARNGVSMSIDSNKRGKKVKQKIEVLMKNVSYKRQENKPTIPGIRNLGCTCYLSVSLQTLYSIPQFLLKLYNSYAKLSSEKELPLTKAFLEIALTIGAFKQVDVPLLSSETVQGTSKSKAADPSALKVQMDVLTNRFAGYEQRDAHEFLGALIDFLHEEFADEEGSNSDTADDEVAATVVTTDLPTDEYFHTKVRVCLECMSWPGYSRSREEFYRHLSVDWEKMPTVNLGESWGVERSLEWFFQAEDRELNCEKCESGTSATQTMEIISRSVFFHVVLRLLQPLNSFHSTFPLLMIISRPKAILLHFKRFIVNPRGKDGGIIVRKNNTIIPLNEHLSISSFCSEKDPNGLYHLCSVVHHIGATASSGHYTTCAKRVLEEESDEERWVFVDDSVGQRQTVDYVTGDEANQKNCYLALYSRHEYKK